MLIKVKFVTSVTRHWQQICHRYCYVVDTGGKLDTGVIDTDATLTCEYLRKFLKKFETTLMLFSGAWGKTTHEKNLKQKFS